MAPKNYTRGILAAGIGIGLPEDLGESLAWTSNRTLADFDVVIARLHLADFAYDKRADHGGRHASESFQRLTDAIAHWGGEWDPYLESGKVVVVILGALSTIQYEVRSLDKGTFRNLDLMPLPYEAVSSKTVRKIHETARGTEVFREHRALADEFVGHTIFRVDEGRALLTTADESDRWLGAELKIGAGRVILLPGTKYDSLQLSRAPSSARDVKTEAVRRALVHFSLAQVERDVAPVDAPDWAQYPQWETIEETRLSQRISALDVTIEAATQQRTEASSSRDDLRRMKTLLHGKGHELEDAVRRAWNEIGLSAQLRDDGMTRIDAWFEHNNRVYVCEVEGRDTKPIDITKYRQLMDMCLSEEGRLGSDVNVRGILVGNGCRLTPPADRRDVFTAQVISTARRQGIILVSATDLYVAWLNATNGSRDDVMLKVVTILESDRGGLANLADGTVD